MRTIMGAVICTTMLAAPASADTDLPGSLSGNDLYNYCTEDDSEVPLYCTGYLKGVIETLTWWEIDTKRCFSELPNGITYVKLKDFIVKYLRDHPEQRYLPAPRLVSRALVLGWPCP